MPSDKGKAQPGHPMRVTVAKSVRIPRADDPERTAFELKNDDGEVSIARIDQGRKCKLEDLETAVGMLK